MTTWEKIVCILFVSSVVPIGVNALSSSNYSIHEYTVSSGGGLGQSSSYSMDGTLEGLQMVASADYILDAGFPAELKSSPPAISSVIITNTSGGSAVGSVNLTAQATTRVYVRGTASDADGCMSIANTSGATWEGTVYRSDVSGGADCTPDDLNCYPVSFSTENFSNCSSSMDSTVDYETYIDMQYWADATDEGIHSSADWTAVVSVTDPDGLSATSQTAFEVNTLTALDAPESVSYGLIPLSEISDEQTIGIQNVGNNNALGIHIHQLEDWLCTRGGFDKENVRYNTTPGQSYENNTPITSTATDTGLAIEKTTDGSASIGNLFAMLQLPSVGLSGTCSSLLTLTGS